MTRPAIHFIPSDAALPEGALLLDNTADVVAQAEAIRRHAVVVLQFPKWTDGRAYSQAVLLRGRVRYAGEIHARGEVLADMLPLLRRCGFDAVQLRADQQLETARRALGYFDSHYQTTPPERAAFTPVAPERAASTPVAPERAASTPVAPEQQHGAAA